MDIPQKPPSNIPTMGTMAQFSPVPPATTGQAPVGPQPSQQGNFASNNAPAGAQDYLGFLARMVSKKAF